MCEVYGFCGRHETSLNKYTDVFWTHASVHKDGFGYFLADKNKLYVNPSSATNFLNGLAKFNFKTKLALCHIRFMTHGKVSADNCHPFVKYDVRGIQWALIHNGYISDNYLTESLSTIQVGQTDSERILLALVESVNWLYEHTLLCDNNEMLQFLYATLENVCIELSDLGKTNLVFTDNYTHNMYVFMNHRNTLFYLKSNDGVHISTLPLSNEHWVAIEPNKLHIFNNGELISN